MEASRFGLSHIAQVAVNVHDLERSAAFYGSALGMKEMFRVPPRMAFFDCAGTRLMLSLPERPEFDHPSSILYFEVADIQKAHETLAERGVRFQDAPHLIARLDKADLWMAFFRDTEGNLLAIQGEVPRA